MNYVNLGSCGMKVSRLALGCMSFGNSPGEWGLDENDSRAVFIRALEMGVTFFDTANMYGSGESEKVLGRLIRDFGRRDEIVLATKVYFPMRPGPNGSGLSRKAIMYEVDESLRRLQTDYIDLYQIHRWDYDTPIEETLSTLDDLVRSGKVRYLGASSMFAWQFSRALHVADQHGWHRFVSMQPHYNLLNREEEREMLPLCLWEGVGVVPWSPLARGLLARSPSQWKGTQRSKTDKTAPSLYSGTVPADTMVAEKVGIVAERHGVSRAQVALGWLLSKPAVTSPILGVTNIKHLDVIPGAMALQLAPEDVELLESSYVPHSLVGYV